MGEDAAPEAPKMPSKMLLNLLYSGAWYEVDFVFNVDTPNPSKLCSRYNAVLIFHVWAVWVLDQV